MVESVAYRKSAIPRGGHFGHWPWGILARLLCPDALRAVCCPTFAQQLVQNILLRGGGGGVILRPMIRPPRFMPPMGPPKRSARQQALAALRGIDLAPLEKVRERPAKAVGDVLPQVLGKLRMEKRQDESEILRAWQHLIDPTVAAHAQPTGLNKGTLFVTVDSSVWLDEIVRYRRKEILTRLQASFGAEMIQRISFRVG